MECEWDTTKAQSNFRKHGVSFEEAATTLADDLSVTGADPDHSAGESRFVTLGVFEQRKALGCCTYGTR